MYINSPEEENRKPRSLIMVMKVNKLRKGPEKGELHKHSLC